VGLLNHSRNRRLIFAPGLGDVVPNAPNSRELDFGTLIPSVRTALEHLAELSALIESRGGHVIALLIPQSFYVVRDAQPQGRMTAAEASRLRRKRPLQRAILKWCEQSRVDCLDLTTGLASHPEHEALYFRGDAHWTPLGHRVAADLLLRRLDAPVVATKAATEASSVATAESKESPSPIPQYLTTR
jgi:hypothetical protein